MIEDNIILASFIIYILVGVGIILSPLILGDKDSEVANVIWFGLLWPLVFLIAPILGFGWLCEKIGELYQMAAYNRAVSLERKKELIQKIRVADACQPKLEPEPIQTSYRDMNCHGCGRSLFNEGNDERKNVASKV